MRMAQTHTHTNPMSDNDATKVVFKTFLWMLLLGVEGQRAKVGGGLAWQQTLTCYCCKDLGRLGKLCVHLFLSAGGSRMCESVCLLCGVYGSGGIKTCLGFLVQPLKDSSLRQRGNFNRMRTRRWAAGGFVSGFWCLLAAGNDVTCYRKCALGPQNTSAMLCKSGEDSMEKNAE